MIAIRLLGSLTWATALLGYSSGTLAYQETFWASFRQRIGRVFPSARDDSRTRIQAIEPREERESDPPYGYQPPPLRETPPPPFSFTSSSSSSSSSWLPYSLLSTSSWAGYGSPPGVTAPSETSDYSLPSPSRTLWSTSASDFNSGSTASGQQATYSSLLLSPAFTSEYSTWETSLTAPSPPWETGPSGSLSFPGPTVTGGPLRSSISTAPFPLSNSTSLAGPTGTAALGTSVHGSSGNPHTTVQTPPFPISNSTTAVGPTAAGPTCSSGSGTAPAFSITTTSSSTALPPFPWKNSSSAAVSSGTGILTGTPGAAITSAAPFPWPNSTSAGATGSGPRVTGSVPSAPTCSAPFPMSNSSSISAPTGSGASGTLTWPLSSGTGLPSSAPFPFTNSTAGGAGPTSPIGTTSTPATETGPFPLPASSSACIETTLRTVTLTISSSAPWNTTYTTSSAGGESSSTSSSAGPLSFPWITTSTETLSSSSSFFSRGSGEGAAPTTATSEPTASEPGGAAGSPLNSGQGTVDRHHHHHHHHHRHHRDGSSNDDEARGAAGLG